MSAWARAMCMVGRHAGEWSHADGRCEIVRTCDSCGKCDVKTRHVWGHFAYLAADQCDQRRHCERCGSTESRVQHDWGPWGYRDEKQQHTGQIRVCRRCHEHQRTRYTIRAA